MNNYYFTPDSSWPEKNRYVRIEAADWDEARMKFIAARGYSFSIQYYEPDFLPQIDEYGLTEIPL